MTRNLILVLIAIGFGAACYLQGRYEGRTQEAARAAIERAQKQAENMATTKRMMRDVDVAAQGYQDRIAKLAADRTAAAVAVGGLRRALAIRAAADPSGTSGADGGPVARALAACAERYSDLANIADGYAEQLIGLQAYARAIAR